MDEQNLCKIRNLLEEIRESVTSEHSPLIKGVLASLETVVDTIHSGNQQIAENQQQIYDALMSNNTELRQQNQMLTEHLKLISLQNQVLLAFAAKQGLPLPETPATTTASAPKEPLPTDGIV